MMIITQRHMDNKDSYRDMVYFPLLVRCGRSTANRYCYKNGKLRESL